MTLTMAVLSISQGLSIVDEGSEEQSQCKADALAFIVDYRDQCEGLGGLIDTEVEICKQWCETQPAEEVDICQQECYEKSEAYREEVLCQNNYALGAEEDLYFNCDSLEKVAEAAKQLRKDKMQALKDIKAEV